jgi:hypothetical protein
MVYITCDDEVDPSTEFDDGHNYTGQCNSEDMTTEGDDEYND